MVATTTQQQYQIIINIIDDQAMHIDRNVFLTWRNDRDKSNLLLDYNILKN